MVRDDIMARAYEARIRFLHRALDNIKVRAWELGQIEIHDMALSALAAGIDNELNISTRASQSEVKS